MKYAHIIQAVYGSPWAIRPNVLAVIVDLLHFRAAGGILTAEEVRERIGAGPTRPPQRASSGVGVLPYLEGVIMKRASLMAQSSGAMSLETWMQSFRAAMDDDEITTIIMPIDSPGGSVDGIPEAAAEIRAGREQKRIVAVADSMAASGAYYLGAQATEFVVTPSGSAGSLGVYTAHSDLSAAYEKEGVKVTLISAGKYKVEGNEFEALTDDARAYAQSVVGDYYDMFVNDVAKGRGVPVAEVRNGFGEGRNLLAKPAKAAGLIDRIDTIGGVVRREVARPVSRNGTVTGRPSSMILGPGWEAVGEEGHEIIVPANGTTTGTIDITELGLPEAPPLEAAIPDDEPATTPDPGAGPEPDAIDETRPPLSFELDVRRRRAAV